jgi:phosphate starvation-inducible PhoH-like protein
MRKKTSYKEVDTDDKVGKKSSTKNSTKSKTETVAPTKIKIKCKNEYQKEFIKMIDEHEITLCGGQAGTGKSYLSLAKALDYILTPDNGYNTLYIITPTVEIDTKLGALPGTLEQKLDPYLFSTYYLIDTLIGKETRIKMVETGVIQALALSFIRGINIDNAILVFEEAQNSTIGQMKTLITRIGKHSKFIISGDVKQIDRFKNWNESGLIDAMVRLKTYNKIGKFDFTGAPSVRNVMIDDILTFYEDKE